MKKTSDINRFWSNVDIKGPDDCWEWKRGCFNHGYGAFRYENKTQQAHRFAWEQVNGLIPEEMFVCHSCDNPICVNPLHLFLGTPKNNMDDMVRKGRSSRGMKRHTAKLNEKIVLEIRRKYRYGTCSHKELSEEYGVAKSTITRIINRKIWNYTFAKDEE